MKNYEIPTMERTAAAVDGWKGVKRSELILAADVVMNIAMISERCGEQDSAELMDTAFRMLFRLAAKGFRPGGDDG